MLDAVEDAITRLHLEIGDAIKLGASKEELANARDRVRRAQMYWDYAAAANGMGFHAPQESARILNKALQFASEGRLSVQTVRARKGAFDPVKMPDISTKELAQAFIKPYVEAQAAPPPTPAPAARTTPTLTGPSQALARASGNR